jgi:hypothetical protein
MDLYQYIESVRFTPFKWGTHDCYQFTSKAIEVQTGRGLPTVFPYSTPKGALRQFKTFYREAHLSSPEAYLDATYIRLPKGVTSPSGGLVLRVYDDPSFKYIFGICLDGRVVFPGANGLEFTDIDFDKDTFWVV